jgi:hypothetical protein
VLFLVLITAAAGAAAQRVTGRLLVGAQVFQKEGCGYLQVRFSVPVSYRSHFPVEAGDEIRIRVDPRALSPDDEAASLSREAVRPPYDPDLPVVNVSYEGDSLEGPVLIIEFRRPLSYSVGQGSDYRSVLVGVPGPERDTPCI